MFLIRSYSIRLFVSFFFNDTATTEIYTLSLHDALPIFVRGYLVATRIDPSRRSDSPSDGSPRRPASTIRDRKSTRLNSSHVRISYAVFCLKKKKKKIRVTTKTK